MKFLHVILLALLFTACVNNKDHFYWGEYETLVETTFEPKEDYEPLAQVQKLTSMIEKAKNEGKPVAPGINAHLGYMKHLVGDDAGAIEALKTEVELFPHSKAFVERLIANIEGRNRSAT